MNDPNIDPNAAFYGLLINSAIDASVVAIWLTAAFGAGHGFIRATQWLGLLTGWTPLAAGVNPHARAEATSHSRGSDGKADSSFVDPPRGFTPAASGQTIHVDATLRRVTTAALGIGVVGFVSLAFGLPGRLNASNAWVILAAGLAFVPWRKASAARPWLRARSPGTAVAWLTAVPAGVMFVAASLPPGVLWKPLDPHPYDVVSYHLQIPREWFELGRIVPLAHNSFSFFPAGQEVHDLLLMHLLGGPWAAMYACQMLSMTLMGLTALVVVGLLRTLGVGGVVAWLAGLLTLCVPWTLMLGSVAYVESGVMLYATLAVAWALLPRPVTRERAGERVFATDERRLIVAAGPLPHPLPAYRARGQCLLIAGAFAGLAGGVKYTALAMTAAPLLVLWPLFAWKSVGKAVWKPWLFAGIACVIAMSPWLVRNAVWAGNPVFPLGTSVFGRGTFNDDQIERYARAHSPPHAEQGVESRLANAWQRTVLDPQFNAGLQRGVAIAGLALIAIAAVVVARSGPGGLLVAMLAAAVLVWIFATHEQPRFLAPAIPLVALILGLAAGRSRVGAWVGGGAMLAVAACGVGWTLTTLKPTIDLGRQGLFRVPLQAIEPPAVTNIRKAGGRLALVGDAQAFFYDLPAGRLKYCGVFDVVVPPGIGLADGWLGEPVEKLRAEGWWVMVSPSELVRLSRTYAHLPAPAPPYDDPAGPPVFLPPTGAER